MNWGGPPPDGWSSQIRSADSQWRCDPIRLHDESAQINEAPQAMQVRQSDLVHRPPMNTNSYYALRVVDGEASCVPKH
jgi:hypothetical protein